MPPRTPSPHPRHTDDRSRQLKDAQRVAGGAAQEVRLIGGRWKRTPLPVAASAGLRPTPARVRETLFNWLGQDLSGWRVLDAFSGSGALGLEAASRGASEVTLLEKDASLARSLKTLVERLTRGPSGLPGQRVAVHQADALAWMRRAGPAFDLVFLDPPFEEGLFDAAMDAACDCVVDGGWIYLEAPHEMGRTQAEMAAVPGQTRWAAATLRHRHGQAGAVHFHLFQRVASSDPTTSA